MQSVELVARLQRLVDVSQDEFTLMLGVFFQTNQLLEVERIVNEALDMNISISKCEG